MLTAVAPRPFRRPLLVISVACAAAACVDTGTVGRESSGASESDAPNAGAGGTGGGAGAGGTLDGSAGAPPDASMDAPADAPCFAELRRLDRPAVDVLWAVETGGPLTGVLPFLEAELGPSFVGRLDTSLLDWRVTMIAQRGMNGDRVCIPEPLAGLDCASAPPRFHAIDCDLGGPDFLTSLGAMYGAVNPFTCRGTGPTPWSALVRFDAYKVLVFVTGDEPGIPPLFWNATAFDNFLLGANPPGMFGSAVSRRFVVHGIVGTDLGSPPAACSSPTHRANEPGLEYLKLAQATGGSIASICDANWPGMLDALARAIISRHECDYPLPRREDGRAVDRDSVAVRLTTGDAGGPRTVPRDESTRCGSGAEGWQFNADESRLLFCGAACAEVSQDPTASVEVELGCAGGPI